MTEAVRCPSCGRTEKEGHAERCPNNLVAKKGDEVVKCCPECGAPVGGIHAERCPFRQAPKAPDERTNLEKTVDDWAGEIADKIPKPITIGWKTRVPMETEDKQRIITPEGRQLGIQSQIGVEKSGIDLLWDAKRRSQPCKSCRFYSREQFEDKDRVELMVFLQREAHWDQQAIMLIMEDVTKFGLCQAHSAGSDSLHVVHEEASCLRLFQPKTKGWLSSFGGKLFGGSGRHGF